MVDHVHTPWFLLMNERVEARGFPETNDTMVDDLVRSGALRNQECIDAFRAVDRRHFWPSDSKELAYADMPLRAGRLHLSAPHIYGKAIESLMPLSPGMSFLNVGSGTGYFSCIVAELAGDAATSHGIDIWPETVAHAKERCAALGKRHVEFTTGNVYQLDVHSTHRYDRIYLGACANSKSKYLYRLLEIGGVLIGPFQVGHCQQLRRVVRRTETQFSVEVLGSVQFASLVEPGPQAQAPEVQRSMTMNTAFRPPPRRPAGSQGSPPDALPVPALPPPPPPVPTLPPQLAAVQPKAGLPGVPFTFRLLERPWVPERCWVYPESFKSKVRMALLCRAKDPDLPCLPAEVWLRHILPWCPRWWFEAIRCAGQPLAALQDASCDDAADDNSCDDGRSTGMPPSSASSSASSSRQSTPQAGPSQPPSDLQADVADGALLPAAEDQPNAGEELVEVFGNGQRHTIGADGDPDDVLETAAQIVVPLRVLRFHPTTRARRRRRRQRESDDEDWPEPEQEEEEEEEEERAPPAPQARERARRGDVRMILEVPMGAASTAGGQTTSATAQQAEDEDATMEDAEDDQDDDRSSDGAMDEWEDDDMGMADL